MISCGPYVEKSLELGKDVLGGDRAEPLIVRKKEKELFISDDGDTPIDDELSSERSLSTSLLLGRNTRGSTIAKSRRKHLHHPALSDVVSGASR